MSYLDKCGRSFDPISPDLTADLWGTLAEMRDRCPVLRSDARGGFAAVTRYHDVVAVAKDWETFSSAGGILPVPLPNPDFKLIPPETDPPLHRQYRRELDPFFTPAAIAAFEDRLREIVIETLDKFTPEGRCEFINDFAAVIPGRVVYDAFYGAPAEDLPDVLRWMHAMSKEPLESVPASRALSAWARNLLEERTASPQGDDDIVARIGTMRFDGYDLSDEERVNVLTTLIFASLDTGEVALATIAARLAENPDVAERLRHADRPAVVRAVEEFLRIDPPATAMARTVTRDTEVAGEQLRAGEKVVFYIASANRDGTKFDHPDNLDIARKPNPHLAFGWGPHMCIGRQLAILELAVSVEEIVRRMPDLAIAPGDEVVFRQGLNRAPQRVPLVFTPTPAEGLVAKQ
jgi:cytochrome P450